MTSREMTDPVCSSAAHQGPLVRAASFLSLAAAALAISGCSIVLNPEPCPEVLCDEGCTVVEDEEGCGTCSCEPEPEPEVCFTDDECADGQRCDTENYCEAPPGCTDGEPCPAVCYGRCVDEPTGCSDDADCADDERCRLGTPVTGDGAQAPEDYREETDQAPEEPTGTGVCVPVQCPERLALPACPPGTELVVDFDDDPCGEARCVPSQGNCRDLDPETCEDTLGCHLEEIAGGCGCDTPAPGDGEEDRAFPCECDPVVEYLCVENDGCLGLDPEACAANPECVGERYIGGCAEDIAPACEDDDDCPDAFPCEPEEEFVCLPRHDEGCFGGADCPPGTICQQETVCTDVCWEAEDGSSGCDSECWQGEGYCAPSTEDCWSLPVEACEERSDCMIDWVSPGCFCDEADPNCGCPDIAEAVCVPVPERDCLSDADCDEGEFCDVEVSCPDCGDGNDIDCAAPCYVEGVCRDGGQPPPGCFSDDDCGQGYACESLTVCEECAPPAPGEDPEPCSGACWEEGICVWTGGPGDYCYSDDDCSDGTQCNLDLCLSDPNCPECDVCVGLCEAPSTGVCWSDGDCPGEQICDSINYCEPSPDCTDGNDCDAVCYGRCVDPDLPGEQCFSDGDCGDGMICEYLDEDCLNGGDPDNGSGLIACLGLCIVVEEPPPPECFTDADCEAQLGGGWTCQQDDGCDPNVDFCPSTCVEDQDCLAVITYAVNPQTESCVEFATPCDVPEGWETVESCNGN